MIGYYIQKSPIFVTVTSIPMFFITMAVMSVILL
jgi:hypothetical protein